MENDAFQLINQPEQPHKQTKAGPPIELQGLLLALTALSKRFVIALSNLFSLCCVASLWYLLYTILPDPTSHQLVGAGGYGVFILILELIRKRA